VRRRGLEWFWGAAVPSQQPPTPFPDVLLTDAYRRGRGGCQRRRRSCRSAGTGGRRPRQGGSVATARFLGRGGEDAQRRAHLSQSNTHNLLAAKHTTNPTWEDDLTDHLEKKRGRLATTTQIRATMSCRQIIQIHPSARQIRQTYRT